MASFADWRPYTNYVQSGGAGPGMADGKFLSGAYVGLFAGPSRLASVGGSLALGTALGTPEAASQIVYPVGIVQNFSLNNNSQWSRIFELGSERSYWIRGRTIGQVGMGRVMYHGPSLLRVLYAYYQDLLPNVVVPSLFPNLGAANNPNPHDVIVPPGYENFYPNLASDLFSQPIGMLVVFKDSNEDTYGAFYLECCVIPQHGIATDAQGVVLQESVGLQFENLIPIATQSLELVT